MCKKILVLIALSLLCLPTGVLAQEPLALSAVRVSLWPEFDRPAMLVIYKISLPPQTMLPVEMSLRIPGNAVPNAVAARHPDGSLLNLNYSQEGSGEWSRLVFQATTPEVQVEYYDNSMTKDGAARRPPCRCG